MAIGTWLSPTPARGEGLLWYAPGGKIAGGES